MKKITAISILACSQSIFAVDVTPSGGTTATVRQIETRDSGYHSIYLTGAIFPNSSSCTLDDRAIINENSSSGNRAMYAAAVAALLSGARLQVVTDGCEILATGAVVTASKIINIRMLPAL